MQREGWLFVLVICDFLPLYPSLDIHSEKKNSGRVWFKHLHLFTLVSSEFLIIKRIHDLSVLQLIGHTVYSEFH